MHIIHQDKILFFFELGANITDTCLQSYETVALNNNDKHYILRLEVIESYFYLWRLTHDQRFRDYAWSVSKAIDRHCPTPHGFSGIVDTSDIY